MTPKRRSAGRYGSGRCRWPPAPRARRWRATLAALGATHGAAARRLAARMRRLKTSRVGSAVSLPTPSGNARSMVYWWAEHAGEEGWVVGGDHGSVASVGVAV